MKIKYTWLFVLGLLLSSCKDKITNSKDDNFKKTELLTQLADNYILPEYASLQTHVNELVTRWNAFENQASETKLDSIRTQWERAYIRFQYVKMFDFGPGMNQNLTMSLGTFPCDTSAIESNITSGIYNLSAISNYDAVGFPSLDYLLFTPKAFEKLTTNAARKKYVGDVILKMKTEIDKTVSEWSSYRNTFVDGSSNSSTSPFSLFVNNYIRDYEILKWTKLGYPLGANTGNIKNPAYLEARNSGIGRDLLRANILALQQIYLGKGSNGKDGKSMHDYLLALSKTTTATSIETNWGVFLTQIEALPSNLETALNTDSQKMIDLYNAIHFNTIALKTDMVSAFGILITYSDNDGD
jgi:predicted lipoprotein